MKIGFINESTPSYGADETTQALCVEAKRRGHAVFLNEYRNDLDFYVIGMYYNESELKKILENKEFVYIEHSVEIFLNNKSLIREYIMPKAKKNFFFSPRQRQHIYDCLRSTYKHLADKNYEYLVVPIDTEFWKPIEVEREKNLNLFVGMIHSNKGVFEVLSIAKQKPEEKFVFIGQDCGDIDTNTFIKEYPNCEYVGHQNKEQLRKWYSKAENLYMLPANGAVESASRVVFEAVLCGCNPIVNSNVGNASYPWFLDKEKIIENINISLNMFFNVIEK